MNDTDNILMYNQNYQRTCVKIDDCLFRRRRELLMDEHGSHGDGWYSHDGEGSGMCTGPGCDCDEKKYGSVGGGRRSGNNKSGRNLFIAFIIACVIGGFCEPLGAIVMLGIIFYMIFCM
jgi:hypothetical protein